MLQLFLLAVLISRKPEPRNYTNLHLYFTLSNTRVRIFFFFVVQSANFFFQNFNFRLYEKHSESDFFFPPPKSEYFFSNIGNQNFFLEKNHSPSPMEVKWSIPKTMKTRSVDTIDNKLIHTIHECLILYSFLGKLFETVFTSL